MLNRQSRIRDPLWYKDAIIYEVRIRSFYDSNADGIGDFPGIIEKLDYLQDLGVDTIWLLPFYPSPLRDDGYDISDYYNIHSDYGNLANFRTFIKEAHQRGLNVITELVLNHTSDQHAWFQRARRAKPNSKWRDYYVWSDTPEKYQEARIIFKDFERSNWTWDYIAKAYYWHRFYSHQPDLNYDSPAVKREVLRVVDFWLGMGVDGMRLDTIPYLFEREGTICENLPETHAFVKDLRLHIDNKFSHRMLLAEANQWPSDAIIYFGKGDECHMAFHFPIMPRLFMSIQLEDSFPVIDILKQTPPIPSNTQWALFLRNHDELTLEMVTDQERDYMYRVYAQDPQARLNLGIRRRLAPLLGNDRRKIELMNGLLFSLPGTPIIYYADEIGMGDNIYLGDRDGVRTPMQWNADRNAGFSQASSQRLCLPITMDPEYHYETINVETQHKNPHSLLWWTKRLIALRKEFKAFGRGTMEFLDAKNSKVLAFTRHYHDEDVLIVANFSRFVQYVELNLASFKGMVPYELFGRTRFPSIGEWPYLLTLGPYSFYWFILQSEQRPELLVNLASPVLPTIEVPNHWYEIYYYNFEQLLASHLLFYLKKSAWFKGKFQPFKNAKIQEKIALLTGSKKIYLTFVRIEYDKGDFDTCLIPIAFTSEFDEPFLKEHPQALIARVHIQQKDQEVIGVLYDAFYHSDFMLILLKNFFEYRRFKGQSGLLINLPNPGFKYPLQHEQQSYHVSIKYLERSVININFGNQWYLKIYRHLEQGINPEVEVSQFLTNQALLSFIPPMIGSIEYHQIRQRHFTLGLLQAYVPNEGKAWDYTLNELDRYFERSLTNLIDFKEEDLLMPILNKMHQEPTESTFKLIGSYLEMARLIGKKTGELHLALSAHTTDPAFAPELTNIFYQRSLYQSGRSSASQVCQQLRRRLFDLTPNQQRLAKQVLELESKILRDFENILYIKSTTMRIRCHGDYHLGQLLFTGKDFIIVDFEQNIDRPLEERRSKRSPLKDVVSMLCSFQFAVYTSFLQQKQKGLIPSDQLILLERSALFWRDWVSVAFLKAYLKIVDKALFIPQEPAELNSMLNVYLLQKAIDDLAYEFSQDRLGWLSISLQWLLSIQGQSLFLSP